MTTVLPHPVSIEGLDVLTSSFICDGVNDGGATQEAREVLHMVCRQLREAWVPLDVWILFRSELDSPSG